MKRFTGLLIAALMVSLSLAGCERDPTGIQRAGAVEATASDSGADLVHNHHSRDQGVKEGGERDGKERPKLQP